MADELTEILGVDREHLARRADFYEHYAATLSDMTSEEISPSVATTTDGWRTAACVGTALRFAAQYALLFDSHRAIRLLREAARVYLDLGVHYGYLLLAMAEPDAVAQHMFSEFQFSYREGQAPDRPLAAAAWAHPAQLTYLLLVMSSHGIIASELSQAHKSVHERLSAHGTAPVGPQSLPVDFYLTFCDTLTSLNDRERRVERSEPASNRIVRMLSQMGRGYEDAIRRAHVNQYLWELQQAPVDIVDLDIVGMTILADVAMREAGMDLKTEVRLAVNDSPTMAMLPIYTGLALHESRPDTRPNAEEASGEDLPG